MKVSNRHIPYGLILIAVSVILFVLFADQLGIGGGAGIGAQQTLMLLFGSVVLISAIFIISPVGKKVSQAWIASSLEPRVKESTATKAMIADLFLMASFFGLAAGFFESLLLSILRLIPQWLTWDLHLSGVTWESWWVTPAVYWALFLLLAVILIPGLILLSKIRALSKILPGAVAILVFGWIGFYIQLTIPDRLSASAISILALGLAFQVARWYSDHTGFFLYLFRRGVPVLALAVIGFLLITRGSGQIRELLLTRNLPDSGPGRPNVIVIVVDTLRADHLSVYGYGKPTSPNIDAFAREGVLFENAYSSSSWTPPGHASLMTGLPVNQHYVDGANPVLDKRFLTLAEFMSSKGYLTAGFSANTLLVNQSLGFNQGFVHFEDFYWSWKDMVTRTVLGREGLSHILPVLGYYDLFGRKRAEDVNRSVETWLEHNRQRPFFVFINYYDVHDPYFAPAPYHEVFMNPAERKQAEKYSFVPADITSEDQKVLCIDAYDGSISYLDEEFGKLIAGLRKQNILDNTLIILTSDHGEGFGEHGIYEHGNSLYREAIHVPIVVRYPELISPGQRIASPVSIKDVPAMVSSVLFPGEKAIFPGDSLTAFISGGGQISQSSKESVLVELTGMSWLPKNLPVSQGWIKSLIDSHYQYIVQEDGKLELFRLSNGGLDGDISSTPEGRAVISRFTEELGKIMKGITSPVVRR